MKTLKSHENISITSKKGKEILKFDDIEIEKISFTAIKVLFFKKDVYIEKVLVSKKISYGEKKNVSTLLFTCIVVMKLSHYIKYFLK